MSFAPLPDVVDAEAGALGGPPGVPSILRSGCVPVWADPAWTSQAKAVDGMHLCEGGAFGLSVRPLRRPTVWRVRFAERARLEEALPPGMSAERAHELYRLIRLCR